jgi:dihydroxyacetone kinase-like predicted kinase
MKASEKQEALQEMKETMEEAIERVEHARTETENNETSSYWMTIKMENNKQGFRLEDIQMAETINHQLGDLIEHYDKMLRLGRDILLELEEATSEEEQPEEEQSKIEGVYEEVKIASLYAKMYLFLKEGEDCLEVEHIIQTDADTLKERLRGRGSWERWYRNMINKFKGVFMQHE